MEKIVSLELNELNFDFVEAYVGQGKLPGLKRLLDRFDIFETVSEDEYALLEPWIQWPTVYSGKTFAEHGIFRLGDIVDANHEQIWERLEAQGVSVGALSPMNAANRCKRPDFFVPDPWTVTPVGGEGLGSLYAVLRDAVNENAHEKVNLPRLAMRLLPHLVRHARVSSWKEYGKALWHARRYKWARAAFLDRFLADLFLGLRQRKGTQFSSLFLNAGAHIQHHHMYEAAVYGGEQENPSWYSTAKEDGVDPLLFVYEIYDGIVSDLMALPDTRLLVTTGLSQVPNARIIHQYRFISHAASLRKLGLSGFEATPRMSRDFLLTFGSEAEAEEAQALMMRMSCQGEPLFRIESRGDSLFCQIAYVGPREGLKDVTYGNRSVDLGAEVVLVSIENGIHRTIGYHIDSARPAAGGPRRKIPLTRVFDTMAEGFGRAGSPPKEKAPRRRAPAVSASR